MTGRASMNHIFRTVWNRALGAMVAISEVGAVRGHSVSRAAGRAETALAFRLNTFPALVAIAWSAISLGAAAAPEGGGAVVGQMRTSTHGNLTTITTQNGPGLNYSAINWQSFSVPQGTTTYFLQPSSSSTVINRVVTATPSQLFGTLGSNGHLVLVNQSGITVGAGAVVDTAGFTASALKMSDADALAGRMRFGDGLAGGTVSVQGQILARSGDVVLIGSTVDTGKDALVQAPNGSTVLAAGNQVAITGRGLEGISMTVQAPQNTAVNLGTLQGDAAAIFAGTLRHSGVIQATRATLEGGKVVLKAAGDAIVDGTATIAATGTIGGSVDVLGQRVGITDSARIDVSGAQGGGQVRIGGDYQGKNAAVPNAQMAYVGQKVSIQANATAQGNGGRVIVWANDTTRAYGSIEAKGAGSGGDGGFVETSGKRALDVNGIRVSASAVAGKSGSWLLDPADVTIVSSVTSGATYSVDTSTTPYSGLFSPLSGSAMIGASDVTNALSAGTDVTVTTYDTTLNPTVMTGGSGNITVAAAIAWSGSAKLTLDANNSITINGAITGTGGQLNLLASNRSGANSGTITNSDINSNQYLVKVNKLQAVANGNIDIIGYNEIQNLAAKSVAGAINIESAHASGLTITNVGGTTGVSALGNITILQYTSGGITVSSAVRSTGNGVYPNPTYQTKLGIASGAGAIAVGADVSGQSVQLYTSGGDITQTAGTVKDNGSGTTLASSGAIALNGANDFSSVFLSGTIGSLNLNDTNGVTFSSGITATGAVTAKSGGNLTFNNVSTPGAVSFSAGGAIIQNMDVSFSAGSASFSAGTGVHGTGMTSPANLTIGNTATVSASTGSGGIYIVSNTSANNNPLLTIAGITAGSGDIYVDNTGGFVTTGRVSATNGAVTMYAHSPVTIGSSGLSASGNILLNAGSDLTLNGPIKSSTGSVSLTAGGVFTQNSSVYGAKGVSASASSMSYGAGATTSMSPVSYTAGGSAVAPPLDPIALAATSGSLVVVATDLLTAAVQEDPLVAQIGDKKDPLLPGGTGEVCLR